MENAPRLTDEELVRRVRAGDEAANRALFDRHREALRAQARRGVSAAMRAKFAESDVVQEAWLAAFLSLDDFEDRGDGSFGRWLRGIVEHRVAREVRRHGGVAKRDVRREVRIPTVDGGATPVDGARSPSRAAMAVEQAGALRDAIEALPPDQGEVVRLVHFEGLTLVAAGERMSRSQDAARKLYGRAIAGLSAKLRRAPPTSG
jgi:RNA polymerase sigma-70 factor (ECF subfamily)